MMVHKYQKKRKRKAWEKYPFVMLPDVLNLFKALKMPLLMNNSLEIKILKSQKIIN